VFINPSAAGFLKLRNVKVGDILDVYSTSVYGHCKGRVTSVGVVASTNRYIGMVRQTPRAGLAMESRGTLGLGTSTSTIANKARIDDVYRSADRRSVLIPYAVPVAIGVLMIESYRAMGA
jgi:hypothetical protein